MERGYRKRARFDRLELGSYAAVSNDVEPSDRHEVVHSHLTLKEREA